MEETSVTEDCPDCYEALLTDGSCYWTGCDVKATGVIYADGIKHKGLFVPTGPVELCAGHFRRWRRLGRLDLDWTVIDAAFRRELTTGGPI